MDMNGVIMQKTITKSKKALKWAPLGILRNVQEASVSGKRKGQRISE